ncbi:hypothetical protein ACH5AL_15195 [Actinacidiphila glaucinigra]|uniref:hypothetical protein n=1 Tax=Actinacidiphila glaucinigra TaxID=235986 RepID=UPI0037A6F46A
MSGCCGQGPVIVSGAAATPRVDVETVLLCDVLPDGTVAGVALVEPVYDTISGDRVGTRTVNPVTGAAYTPGGTLQPCQPDGCNATTTAQVLCDEAADGTLTHFVRATTYDCEGALLGTLDRTLDGAAYTVTGTVGVCPTSPDCESPTTPVTSVGLCLADGTPIAVTVVRDCAGAVTSEGWINLSTGAWSAGAVPVGTVACGESRSIQVSGTFCDVDAGGDVVGLVLVEYTYDDTGAIASVRLVDAVTGGTYTPTGTVTVCPAGVEQPERDLLQLCDTAPDGTVTPFVRDYARDETGAIVGHSDYALDGTPYTPTGTVGMCGPDTCTNTTSVLLCDAPADSTVTVAPTVTDGTPADVAQTQFTALGGAYTALWSGGSLVFPADPGPAQTNRMAVGQFLANPAGCDGASGTLTVSVRVTQDGPGTGQLWDGALRLFRGTTVLADDVVLNYAPPGHVQTLTVSTPVTAADLTAGDIRIGLVLETFHGTPKSWTADQFSATVALDGCDATAATQFLRHLVTDCETGEVVAQADTTLDGDPYTVTGDVAQCQPVQSSDTCRNCVPIVLCDSTDTPGAAPHSFLRTVCRDCDGNLLGVTDTELDGTTAYSVSGEIVDCAAAEACGDVEIAQLCDLVAAPATPIPVPADSFTLTGNVVVIGDTLQFSRNNVAVTGVAERAVTGLINGAASALQFEAGWGGGGNPPATNDAIYKVDILDGATVLATSTVNLSNGSGSAGAVVAQPPLAFPAPSSGSITVRFTDLSTGGALNRDLVIRPLTVDTEGTSLTARPFLRAYAYDCTGQLQTTTDTELDGSTAYTPQGEVGVCSEMSDTATTTEPSPVNTGVRAVTGAAAQDLAAEFPALQSVSLAVLAGAVNVTMSDGTDVPIPAGVTLTWSVSKDTDTALTVASFAGADASASYLLNWTHS